MIHVARSLYLSALCSLGTFVANPEFVVGFLPVVATPSAPKCRHRAQEFRDNTQTPRQRRPRAQALVAAAGPPDDFIDTTAVEEEGSSYVGVDFERQELRVIFETMDKNNIFYKMLSEEQITKVLQLTQALLSVKQMPVDISNLCKGDGMKGKWKLEFSTEERYKLLPPTAEIYNYIYDGNGRGRMDNIIRFYKSLIVKSVRAITNYKMDTQGKIIFAFGRIEADLLGFKVPLPNFGMGTGFFEVQYFDGDLWIETFEAPTSEGNETMTVINIYRRVGDATEEDKTHIPERNGDQRQPQR